MFDSAGYTDIGQRKHNEDSYLLDKDLGLYIVADGVGGLQAGEVASKLVCEVVRQCVGEGDSLEEAIASAHGEVMAATQRGDGRAGMASTIVAARITGNDYELAWVGDSRIYLWDGELKLLSKDHSYVQSLFDAGQISLAEMDTHPKKNVITQAVGGSSESIKVSVNRGTMGEGNSMLLCSDGVSGELTGAQLLAFMSSSDAPEQVARDLVMSAVNAGGKDNATCVYLRASKQDETNTEGATARSYKPEVFRTYDAANDSYLAQPSLEHAVDAQTTAPQADSTVIVRAKPRAEVSIESLGENTEQKQQSFLFANVGLIIAAGLVLLGVYLWVGQ